MKHHNVHSALDGAMKEEAPSHIHPSAPTEGRGEREEKEERCSLEEKKKEMRKKKNKSSTEEIDRERERRVCTRKA